MASAYRFLRRVEHLLQLRQLRRTHLLPEDPAILREIGRALRGMRNDAADAPPAGADEPAAADGGRALRPARDPAADLAAQWRLHGGQARQLHEKLFYRPLLDAVARLPGEATRLTPEAARDRLEALGFADPAGALRHIESLTAGMSRKAAMQRTLLPVLLDWLADAPEPDAGLLAFRQVSEALGSSPWYLRLLRDNAVVAQRMARLLASSRYATGLLLRAPEAVAMLGDDAQLTGRPAADLVAEASSAVGRALPHGGRRRPRTVRHRGHRSSADDRRPGDGRCSPIRGDRRDRTSDWPDAHAAGRDRHGPIRRPGDGLRQ
jgi:glutamate-ammonia-ligase adenylyltransferase